MNLKSSIKFYIFLISAFYCFTLFCNRCSAQRAAGESRIISGAKNVFYAAAPLAKDVYQRMENRSSAVKGISNLAGQAVPLVEKAVPIVRKGFAIGKKVLKILKRF